LAKPPNYVLYSIMLYKTPVRGVIQQRAA